MQRIDQPLSLARVATGKQSDLAAFQPVIGQRDGPGRAFALDGKARHPVAQFYGQVQRDFLGGAVVRLEHHALRAQNTLDPQRVGADGGNLDRASGAALGAQHLGLERAVREAGRGQRQRRARVCDHPHRATIRQRVEEGLVARGGDAIGQPDGLESLVLDGRQPFGKGGAVWPPGLRGEARDAVRPALGCAERQARFARDGFGQRQQRGGAAIAGGLVKDVGGAGLPLCPVRGRGPAAVHQHQHRAGAAFAHVGVQHRVGERDDRGGQRTHAQGQQPPRRALGHPLGVFQAHQQPHAGEHAARGRGRHSAQQPPQDR